MIDDHEDPEDYAPVTPRLREIATHAIEHPEVDNDRGRELSRGEIAGLYYTAEACDSHNLTWEENRTVGALIDRARITADVPTSLSEEVDVSRSPVEGTENQVAAAGGLTTGERLQEDEALRVAFNEALTSAQTAVAETEKALRELIETFAVEGQDGRDMAAFLADAARMIRAAKALNPCPTN